LKSEKEGVGGEEDAHKKGKRGWRQNKKARRKEERRRRERGIR